jgi:exportin-T
LQALFKKLRYDDSVEDPSKYESELEADFHDLRKRILSFEDSIAMLDPDLYPNSVYEFITGIFQRFVSASNVNWRDLEVALFQLHAFIEPLKGSPYCVGSHFGRERALGKLVGS